ncbi:Microtubule-associated protein TORTIFOLIA1 [Acorus calamus]|uniref:Microtubule-associated protein TORTIFOLIA1 n=1 Tax=Acorus calamus TaxID=4465 RepID=A0AAV9E1J1_ACOCL|nr:Microtubule-associated protein TORTIFOLIA1 [Acorus calamus]
MQSLRPRHPRHRRLRIGLHLPLPHPETLPVFISSVSDVRPSDKTPVRRHSLRLLSSLPPHLPLHPLHHLPRVLSALLRLLRDPDSSVRAACVDAVRSIASSSSVPFHSLFKPFSEAVATEQDAGAQAGAALCLAAAVEAPADPDRAQLRRLLPRLLKLLRSEAFKAKPALMELIGKAAAEVLSRLALSDERDLLVRFKSSCLASIESKRFDKVKIVRDTMNQLLEDWKSIPSSIDQGCDDVSPPHPHSMPKFSTRGSDNLSARSSSAMRSISPLSKKNRSPISRSPPPNLASAKVSPGRRSPTGSRARRSSPPIFQKLERSKKPSPSDWKIEVSVPRTLSFTVDCNEEGIQKEQLRGSDSNAHTNFDAKLANLKKYDDDDKVDEIEELKPSTLSRVVPVGNKDNLEFTGETCGRMKDGELSVIRSQLIQIEKQQSSLLDLLQTFIGSSQSGMRALETRVHGLEMALDEISHDLAVTSGRMTNTDSSCCKLPGAEFLSSKFWRKSEVRRFYPFQFHTYINLAIFDAATSCDHVRGLINDPAEHLVHLFCVVPCQPLIHDDFLFQYPSESELVDHLKSSKESLLKEREEGIFDSNEPWRRKI